MSDQHPKDPNAAAPEEALQDYVDMMLAPCDLDAQVEEQNAARHREEKTKRAQQKQTTRRVVRKKTVPRASNRNKTGTHSDRVDDNSARLPPAASLVAAIPPETDPGKSAPTTLALNKRNSIDVPVLGNDSAELLPQRQEQPARPKVARVRIQQAEASSSADGQRQTLDETLVRERVKQLTERLPPSPKGPTTVDQTGDSATPETALRSPLEAPSAKGGYELQARQASATAVPGLTTESEFATQSAGTTIPDGWCDNGRPEWAQQPFECLLFKLSGLTLAVPLVELGSIYPLQNELTPIFGQADWFLGLFSIQDISIRAVDTAKVIMPERYKESMKQSLRYIISINGYDWGLAVDEVDEAITLTPDDVRWRTARSKRPWLAGTVVQQMCALLDVRAMAREFDKASHPRS